MNSNDLIKDFKSRLLNSNKNSTIFYNSFKKGSYSINFKKMEEHKLLRANINDKSPISLKKAINLKKFYISFFDIEKNKDEKEYRDSLNFANEIKRIISKERNFVNEKNINALYMGTFFVEGCMSDDSSEYFRAPLLLQKMIIHDMGRAVFEVLIDDEKILNNSLLNIIATKNKQRWEYEELIDDEVEFKTKALEYFNRIGYRLNDVFSYDKTLENEFDSIKGLSKKEQGEIFLNSDRTFLNQSYALNICSFGIYDIAANTILAAYNELEKNDLTFLEDLFLETENIFSRNELEWKEKDLITISDLDYTQKDAVANSLNESSFIFGPPGTGKSQVIVNLIANIINKKQSSIFVTEKRVASKVVYDKLKDLNDFVLMFHNEDGNQTIFNKVKKIYTLIEDYMNISESSINSEYLNYAEKIDDIYDYIKQYKTLFQTDQGKTYIEFQKIAKYFEEKEVFALDNYDILEITKSKETLLKKEKITRDLLNLYEKIVKNTIEKPILDYVFEKNNNIDLFLFNISRNKKINKKVGFFSKKSFLKFKSSREYLERTIIVNEIREKYYKNELLEIDNLFNSLAFLKNSIIKDISNEIIILSYVKQFEKNNHEIINLMSENWSKKIRNHSKGKNQEDLEYVYTEYLRFIIRTIKLSTLKNENGEMGRTLISVFNELGRQISKTKTSMRLKTLFNNYGPILKLFFPILIGSPETICNHKMLPLRAKKFDYAIFDEASQIFTEKCIPILFRAKKYVISGDDKQLPPTNFFKMKNDYDYSDIDAEENALEMEIKDTLGFESLIDFAKGKFKRNMLQYHYRSINKELIDFSNSKYYENKLIISKQVNNQNLPIEVIKVDGIRENSVNEIEALEVVKTVIDILKKNEFRNKTIGIITFNVNQQRLVLDKLEIESENNQELYLAMYKKEPGEELFVKSIENVQGDERDVIIFSIGFSHDHTGKFRNAFGPLAMENGEKRLNVAITRAKEKMFVIKSIPSSIISSDKRGVNDFKEFLKYCELLQEPSENEDAILSLLNNETRKSIIFEQKSSTKFDSEFEVEVFDEVSKLLNQRYELHTQIPASGFKLDQAIFDTIKEKYILAIECDGWTYHSNPFDKQRDYERQAYLENRGWKFTRILSTHWWHSNQNFKLKFLENIKDEINYYESFGE